MKVSQSGKKKLDKKMKEILSSYIKAAKEEKSFSQISGLFEKNSKYEKENKEFYDDLKEQLSSKDGYKADQITTDNYEGKYVISGVTCLLYTSQFPGNDDRSSIRCILRIYHVQSE